MTTSVDNPQPGFQCIGLNTVSRLIPRLERHTEMRGVLVRAPDPLPAKYAYIRSAECMTRGRRPVSTSSLIDSCSSTAGEWGFIPRLPNGPTRFDSGQP